MQVANGHSCGGIFKLAPHADVRDGLLDVCWIKKTNRLKLLWFLPKGIKGTHLSLHEVRKDSHGRLPRVSSLTIHSDDEDIPCQMDGELFEPQKKYKISILPKALKVLVP